jgi:ribosome modulation factor
MTDMDNTETETQRKMRLAGVSGSAAWHRGFADGVEGTPLTRCPYRAATHNAIMWSQGQARGVLGETRFNTTGNAAERDMDGIIPYNPLASLGVNR